MVYNTLIIGAGFFGAMATGATDEAVPTHAQAVMSSPNTCLVGFVDANLKNLELACSKWKVKGYHSIKEALQVNDIDIVIITVPDEAHDKVLNEVLAYPLKFIICEKPLTHSEEQLRFLLNHEKRDIICVNYFRRFLPSINSLKLWMQQTTLGQFRSAMGTYVKGFSHNGSHVIDLLLYLQALENIENPKVLQTVEEVIPNDPTLTVSFEASGGLIVLQGKHMKDYAEFNLVLNYEFYVITVSDFGNAIRIDNVVPLPEDDRFNQLSLGTVMKSHDTFNSPKFTLEFAISCIEKRRFNTSCPKEYKKTYDILNLF